MSNSNFLTLTCDGGGIRGLITAMVIQELDKKLHFLDKVDLFAGTSTGGIISLALASGVPISEIVGIYGTDNSCSQIFTPYNPTTTSGPGWLQKIGKFFFKYLSSDEKKIVENLDSLLYVKYNNVGLQNVLQSHFKQPSQTLESLQSKVLVATFQLDNKPNSPNSSSASWRPIILDNLPNNTIKSEETKIIDAALCTSAAPTYFPPHHHPTYGFCVDGGVFANNPSTLALARALGSGVELQNIRMLSIGTGVTQSALPPSYQPDPLRYGATTWLWPETKGETPAFPLLEILMDGSPILDDHQTKMFLGDTQYWRINVQLNQNIGLDDCSQISTMKQLVNDYTTSPQWEDNINWINNYFL
ncbi:MAG: patatin-like phospholipase family protein [Calothrix sp. MO_167.B42]|nr:patatin-like phospholipase family protein [Calothrix sp. MO_167.B42]